MVDIYRNDFSRMFLQRWGAGPTNVPVYQGLWKAGAARWPQGDITLIRIPDPDQYGQFKIVGKIPGEPGSPTLEVQARYTLDVSDLLKLAKDGCDNTLHIHMGKCRDPRDFNQGWDKVLILEKAVITDYSTDDLGAMVPADRGLVNETVPFTGEDLYEVKRLALTEQAGTEVVKEVVDITICDSKTCGLCGLPSDGCSIVFAVVRSATGSPGTGPDVVFSNDGGATWSTTSIATMTASEAPEAIACVGAYLVVVSNDSESLHYAPIADILDGTETWTEVTTGFVAAKGPLDITSLGSAFNWIAAKGGYIYFSDDVTAGVEVQTAGALTVQDQLAIHALDLLNVLSVGLLNTVLVTRNGGSVWELVTGPLAGAALDACWMISEDVWWVGSQAGRLYYTLDGGVTWTEKAFPGSGAGEVKDIAFVTPSVGYIAHATAAPAGRILRTIDGGNSWYVLPEGTGTIPANDGFNALAVCEDPNLVFGGGLGDNAVDGIIVKAN